MFDLAPNLTDFRPGVGAFLPIALAFIALEFGYARLATHDRAEHYDTRETMASIGVAIGNLAARILTSGIAAVPFLYLYQNRLFDIPLDRWWTIALLFLGVEFCYYWFHRASHHIRWFWATHAVHHSATKFNLSAAIRLGWTGQLTGAFVFFLPLAWIGVHPLAIVGMLGLGLLYQFFLHTHLDISLGPLEWVLNTPRHHRVHHACNDGCLDRNFGSVLIVFDRVFGTFASAPENERLVYGIKAGQISNNPLKIALGEWVTLIRDVRASSGIKNKLRTLISPP